MKSDAAHSYWVHDLSPFLVRFSDSFGIRYYGLAYMLGFLIAVLLLLLYWRAGCSALDPKAQSDLLVAVVIGVILGGRLGYFLLYSPATFLREPLPCYAFGMGDMGMRVPKNSLPMVGGNRQFGYITMGGMFTLLKVRDEVPAENADPGWYQNPPGTISDVAPESDLKRDGITTS